MGLAATLSAAVLSVASPSKAFLGIGEDIQQQYTDQTVGGPREGVEREGQDACGMHAVHACMQSMHACTQCMTQLSAASAHPGLEGFPCDSLGEGAKLKVLCPSLPPPPSRRSCRDLGGMCCTKPLQPLSSSFRPRS